MSRRLIHRYPSRWRKLREAVFQRDGWKCTECDRVTGLEVDHIVPFFQGGREFDINNCQTLCKQCHTMKTKMANRGTNKFKYMQKFTRVCRHGFRPEECNLCPGKIYL